MKVRLGHRTTYTYAQPVSFRTHRLMIRPREGHDVHIESSILRISPPHTVNWVRDVNGNCIALADFLEPARVLTIYSELVLMLYNTNPLNFLLEESAHYFPFRYAEETEVELKPFREMLYPEQAEALTKWGAQFWQEGEKIETVSLLQRVNLHIVKNFSYQRREEKGVQTPAETLEYRSGTCRDFAMLMLEMCRCWGLGARFVSGYMVSGESEDDNRRGSTHAWLEVYLPGAGWKGFDPTTGLVAGAWHIAVAVARDPRSIPPVTGSYVGPSSAFQSIEVDVQMTRLDAIEPPPRDPFLNPRQSAPDETKSESAKEATRAPAEKLL